MDVDDNVVVGGGVDIGSWKFTVDENGLLGDSKWRNGAIGDIPREEEIRVFTPDHRHRCSREAQQKHKPQGSHVSLSLSVCVFLSLSLFEINLFPSRAILYMSLKVEEESSSTVLIALQSLAFLYLSVAIF